MSFFSSRNVCSALKSRRGRGFGHRRWVARAAHHLFQRRGRIRHPRAAACAESDPHAARLRVAICTLNPASRRFNAIRCAASCIAPSPSVASVSWPLVNPPRSSCALFRSRRGGKQKRIARDALRQKARRHFSLLLKDHIVERAAIDRRRNCAAQFHIRQRARCRKPAAREATTGGEASTLSRCCCAWRNCSAGTSTTSARPTLRSSH